MMLRWGGIDEEVVFDATGGVGAGVSRRRRPLAQGTLLRPMCGAV